MYQDDELPPPPLVAQSFCSQLEATLAASFGLFAWLSASTDVFSQITNQREPIISLVQLIASSSSQVESQLSINADYVDSDRCLCHWIWIKYQDVIKLYCTYACSSTPR